MDVVLLGLPHKVSAGKAQEIMQTGARIVDLSGDFRLRDPDVYEKYYGAKHPCPEELTKGTFVYGLPELSREAIQRAKYVASPGCFATTIELALLPLAKAGLLSGPVEVVGITGSSGSGIAPSAGTHHPTRSNNLKTYKPLEHQHIPEITQTLAAAGAKGVTLRFVPVSAPLSRGIFATCFAHVDEKIDAAAVRKLFAETYAREPFVRVPAKRLPEVVAVKGTNYAEVGVQAGDAADGKRVIACFAATDNLVKGGAGQAIQSMNLMLGLDERLTLEDPGGWP
jgi:N-acetyl-gamma-glutamyl-phosphate reductase